VSRPTPGHRGSLVHSNGPAASVVITTRNRCSYLRQAIASALAQTADVEVLVIDDGSTDGTAAMVQREFPQVRFFRDEQARGYIHQRNRAATLATAPIIVSIDDDARLVSSHTVAQTLLDFDDERVGVVAIPYMDLVPRRVARQMPPDPNETWIVFRYFGTAHAIRRDVFLALGGYRSWLGARCEEADLCVRALDAGYVTRLGRADPIHHIAAPRDSGNNMLMQARNDLLHAWANVPARFLPMRLLQVTLRHLCLGVVMRHPYRVAVGLFRGFRAIADGTVPRSPVRIETHRIDRRLRKRGPITFHEIASRLRKPGASGSCAEVGVAAAAEAAGDVR
jgi:glycosyltransferase involved in cell wall biosynthesis